MPGQPGVHHPGSRTTRLQCPVSPVFTTQYGRTTRLQFPVSLAFTTRTRTTAPGQPGAYPSPDTCLRLPVNLVHSRSQEPFPDLLLASPVHFHSPDLFLRLLRASPSLRLPASLVSRKLLAKL